MTTLKQLKEHSAETKMAPEIGSDRNLKLGKSKIQDIFHAVAVKHGIKLRLGHHTKVTLPK